MPKKRNFTQEEENDILHQYLSLKIGSNSIADKYGVTQKVIKRVLKENNIEIRYPTQLDTVNENYFEEINTEDKAYFLGLLFGDGCVLDNGTRQKRLTISLQERDKSILEQMIKCMEYSGKLRIQDRAHSPGRARHQKSAILHISSNKLCEDLIKLGCTPRKSLTLLFPTQDQVPNHLIRHFIRGLYDSDGSVHSSLVNGQERRFMFDIYGTKSICEGVRETFHKNINFNLIKIIPRRNIFMLPYNGNRQVRTIYEYLYKDSKIWVPRKKERFERIFI